MRLWPHIFRWVAYQLSGPEAPTEVPRASFTYFSSHPDSFEHVTPREATQ